MLSPYTPYVAALIGSGVVTTLLALYAWRHRSVPGAGPFAATMLLATLWAVAYTVETVITDLESMVSWANIQYLSFAFMPVSWLAMSLQFAGRDRWLTQKRLAWLCLVPTITVLLALTSDLHNLIRYDVHLDTDGPFPVVGKSYGFWFWAHSVYSYLLFGSSIALLFERLLRTPSLYRGQLLPLLFGMLLPMAGSASFWLGFSPIQHFDLGPVLLGISGCMVAWALFRFRLFDIVPLAHDRVIEGMGDGVIVLDTRGQIAEFNLAARRVFGRYLSDTVGRSFAETFSAWPELVALSRSPQAAHTELALGDPEDRSHYEIHVSPLADRRWGSIGQVIALREVTEQKRARELLLHQQRALAVLEERERLARELHDSLGQVLGYVNTQAQAVRELLAQGQLSTADGHLARLVAVAQDAHADVREYILGLKAATSPQQGFFPSLRQYLQRFSQNHQIRLDLTVPPHLEEEEPDPAVGVQLLRIIQEALTNVRKHADASQVHIVFAIRDNRLEISVEDDGRGFDTEQASRRGSQHFGLWIMRERAQEVAGTLHLHSTPGAGTKVVVQVPLSREIASGSDEATAGR